MNQNRPHRIEDVHEFVRDLLDRIVALPGRLWAGDITIAASTYDICVTFTPGGPGDPEPSRYLFDVEEDTIRQIPAEWTPDLCRMVDPPGLPCTNPATRTGLCIDCLRHVLDNLSVALPQDQP